jgi:hypothetical protein
MLTFRARGFNLRDNFGDVLKGFNTQEELRDALEPLPSEDGGPLPIGRVPLRNGKPESITHGVSADQPSSPVIEHQPPQPAELRVREYSGVEGVAPREAPYA